MFSDEAIHVYVDGSYNKPGRAAAYGWVLAEPRPHLTQARVVSFQDFRKVNGSSLMEAAAFIDALAEFAPRQRHIVIHGDCTSLSRLIEKYRAGLMGAEGFFAARSLREEDVRRLLPLLDTASFEFQWVKGHSGSFHNSVVDQMLRMVTSEGKSETEAVTFSELALATGEAVIYGTVWTPDGCYNGYSHVYADASSKSLATV